MLNDENTPPSLGPNVAASERPGKLSTRAAEEDLKKIKEQNDRARNDRARFGFTKPARQSRQRDSGSNVLGEPEEERSVSGAGPEETSSLEPVDIVSLIDRTLGNADADLKLLRSKQSAGKFDFKGRINELTEQNKSLRAALLRQREDRKKLTEHMCTAQAHINWRLRKAEAEAGMVLHNGNLMETVQEAMRAVVLEQSCENAWGEKRNGRRSAGLGDKFDKLQESFIAEATRAAEKEALVRTREHELRATRHRLKAATQLVNDAGCVLQTQQAEQKKHFKLVLELARQKGKELAKAQADAAAAQAKIAELEAEVRREREAADAVVGVSSRMEDQQQKTTSASRDAEITNASERFGDAEACAEATSCRLFSESQSQELFQWPQPEAAPEGQ